MTTLIKLLLPALMASALMGCGNGNKPLADSSSGEATATQSVTLESLQLTNLDGSAYDLSALAGKRVFVNFWATWCKPCLAEMPSIDRATEALGDKNVIMIAASDEKPERILNFRDKFDYQFIILSTTADLATLQVYALPTTFIFDEQGQMVYKEAGAREWDSKESIDLITDKKKL